MSGQRKIPGFGARADQHRLNHLLDFGPEKTEPTPQKDANALERIKLIVKKLQEINKRIDDLASRL